MQIRGDTDPSQCDPDYVVDSMGKGIKELLSFGKTTWLMDCSREFCRLINMLDKYTLNNEYVVGTDISSYDYALSILKDIYSEMEPNTGDILESIAKIQKSVLLKLGIIDYQHYGIMPDNTIIETGYSIYMKLKHLGLFMNRKRNKLDFPFYVSNIDQYNVCLTLDSTLL